MRALRGAAGIALALPLLLLAPSPVGAACGPVGITPNTPTGIAGCERSGQGIASWYGAGTNGYGAAMNFCTWKLRHTTGCGSVRVTAANGNTADVPIVDFCDCFTGTSRERIIDLLPGVLVKLGLNPSAGLYPVTVTPIAAGTEQGIGLPNTAMAPDDFPLVLAGAALWVLASTAIGAAWRRRQGEPTPEERIAYLGVENRLLFNEDGTIDEVVYDGYMHLEQMDDGQYWLGVGNGNRAGSHFWLRAVKKGVLHVTTADFSRDDFARRERHPTEAEVAAGQRKPVAL